MIGRLAEDRGEGQLQPGYFGYLLFLVLTFVCFVERAFECTPWEDVRGIWLWFLGLDVLDEFECFLYLLLALLVLSLCLAVFEFQFFNLIGEQIESMRSVFCLRLF